MIELKITFYCSQYLNESDLFIYCGHGSGEKYIHRDRVKKIGSDCCAALLIGCSSGKLHQEGIYEPHGAILSYLLAGSPSVVGMLWDVTDRDIDRFSLHLLQTWLDPEIAQDFSLAQVLQQSKQTCKLKHLNGYAAICYGIPLYVEK